VYKESPNVPPPTQMPQHAQSQHCPQGGFDGGPPRTTSWGLPPGEHDGDVVSSLTVFHPRLIAAVDFTNTTVGDEGGHVIPEGLVRRAL